MKSFADPSTEFELVFEEQPVGSGGLTAERPTGEVSCRECGRVALNVDEIPHAKNCSQRFVHSSWYADQLRD